MDLNFNPIIESSGGDFIVLEGGTYNGKLESVDLVKRKSWNEVERKFSGPERDELRFKFAITAEDGTAYAVQHVTPSNGEKSNLTKLLKTMGGKDFNDNIRKDKDQLWAYIRTLVGNTYMLGIAPKGNWNNITSVLPMPKGQVVARVGAAKPDDFNDDDIPF